MTKTKEIKKLKDFTKQRKITDILIWILVAMIGIVIFFSVILLIIGYRPAVVLTGSMRPTITPGDMIIYKGISENDIKVGDILTFYMTQEAMDSHSITYTHRVIAKTINKNGEIVFQMQGDANETPDSMLIPKERILGKVSVVVPWIGQLFLFVKHNLILVVGFIFVISLIIYLSAKLIKDFNNKKHINI